MELRIHHFFDPSTSTLSYVVYDASTRDAVIIDPVLDFDPASGKTATTSLERMLAFLDAAKLKAHWVLETHAHADHLSGAQFLKRKLGVPNAIGEHITLVQSAFAALLAMPSDFVADGSQFDKLLKDGERLHAGSLAIDVLATPGHTPACVSYHIADAVFVGDALFIDDSGTGRCDFPRGDASALYHSVHERLYALPPQTRIFVGHDYQPKGRDLAFMTTVASARDNNIHIKAHTTRDEFVHFRTERDRTLSAPRLLFPSVQVNIMAGRLPKPDANGRRFLHLPLNPGVATLDDGSIG